MLLLFAAAKHQQKLRLSERTDNGEQQSKKQQTTPSPDSTTSPTPPVQTQVTPIKSEEVGDSHILFISIFIRRSHSLSHV